MPQCPNARSVENVTAISNANHGPKIRREHILQCPLLIHKRSPEMFVRSSVLIYFALPARPLYFTQFELLDLAGSCLGQFPELH